MIYRTKIFFFFFVWFIQSCVSNISQQYAIVNRYFGTFVTTYVKIQTKPLTVLVYVCAVCSCALHSYKSHVHKKNCYYRHMMSCTKIKISLDFRCDDVRTILFPTERTTCDCWTQKVLKNIDLKRDRSDRQTQMFENSFENASKIWKGLYSAHNLRSSSHRKGLSTKCSEIKVGSFEFVRSTKKKIMRHKLMEMKLLRLYDIYILPSMAFCIII